MFPVSQSDPDSIGKVMLKGFADLRGRSSSKTEHDRKLARSVRRTRSGSAINKSMDLADHIKPSYYMEQLKYHFALKNLDNETTKKFKEHFLRNLASMKFIKTIRMPSMDNVAKSRMQLAKLEDSLEKSKLESARNKDYRIRP